MVSALSLPFIDAMETADSTERGSDRVLKRHTRLVEELVAASLDEYRHICALDKYEPGEAQEPFDQRVADVLKNGYDQWATQAEALLARIASLQDAGHEVQGRNDLKSAVADARAMLGLSMEAFEKGMEQIRIGKFITLEEGRRELRVKRGR